MFKKIMVALDGSTYSKLVLPAAIEVATKFDGEILVLHVSEHDRGRSAVFTLETPSITAIGCSRADTRRARAHAAPLQERGA